MAKSKKSKILAMALCASVMTGIYASPVMADNVNASFDSISGNIVFTIAGDTYTINKDDITNAIARNPIHSNSSISANGGFIARSGNYAILGDTQYAMLANKEYFALGDGLLMNNSGNEKRATFYVDNATGDVTTKGTLSGTGLVAEGADGGLYVQDIGGKTMILARPKDGYSTLRIDPTNGNLSTKGTMSVADENWKTVTQIQGYDPVHPDNTGDIAVGIKGDGTQMIHLDASTGSITATNFNGVELATDGNKVLVGDIDVNDLKDKTQYMYHAATNTTGFKGAVNVEGNIRSTYGGFVIGDGSTALHKGNLELDGEVLSSAKLGTINDVIDADGNVKGTTVTTAAGADLDVVNGRTKNMTTIGSTTVFNNKVAINDAGISMPGDNGGTGIMIGTNGTIYSQNGMSTSGDFKTEAGYTLNTVGADLKTLTGNVGNIGGNVAGIHRDAAEGAAYGEGVTSIEGVVDVDGNNNLVHFRNAEGNTSVLINAGTGQIIADSIGANDVTTAKLSAGNGAFKVSEDGTVRVQSSDLLMQNGSGESVAMNGNGLNLMTVGDNGTGMVTLMDGTVSLMGNGTSTVTVDENGTTFGTVLGSETTNINGGTVTASGDFVTVDENGETKYTLNTIGDNTQAIQYQDGVTTIGGETLAVTDEGYVTINNGAFAIGQDGMATVGSSIQLDGETGVVSANDLIANYNVYSENYNLEEVGDNLDDLTGSVDNIGGNVAGISRNDGDLPYGQGVTSIEGSTSFDANGMNVGNGAVLANTDGSFSAANGAFDVDTNGNVTANRVTVGNTVVTGSSVTTDYLQANSADIDGVLISGGLVDGVDVSALGGAFDSETGVVGGISREDRLEDIAGLDTTVIEDSLSVNKENINMFGDKGLDFTYGTLANNENEGVVNVSGNINFASASDVFFNYGGYGENNKYAGSYTLEDLADTVADIYDRTQGISYDEDSKTTVIDGNLEVNDPTSGDGGEGNPGEGGNNNFGNGNFDGDVNADNGNFRDKVTVGSEGDQTVIDGGNVSVDNSVTVGGSDGVSIKNDEVRVGAGEDGQGGSYMNENDVVTGEGNSLNDTANRVGNLEQGVSELNNRVGELEDRIDKVGAMAAAIANLRTMGYDPAAPTEVAVGIGQYRDETGAALGLFHYPNRDFMLSLSVSTSGDEVMGGIGATWKFGRKSPEKVAEIKKAQAEADARRAEEAKLAKAEEMKQAAKEAKIKAQQERHAKLAAERAAQAEAAK